MKVKFVYKYWFHPMDIPCSLPADCEWYSETGSWVTEILHPKDWYMCKRLVRRWKVEVKSARRPSKHERLLKALLKCFTVESKLLLISGHLSMLTPKNEQQLIAIKQRMEKGVKV